MQLADGAGDGAHVAHGLDHIAGAGLTLGTDHGRPFGNAAQGFTEVAAATDKRDLKNMFVDVVLFIGWGEDLALVDLVAADRPEHLRFHALPAATLPPHPSA